MSDSMIERVALAILIAPMRSGVLDDFIHMDEARSIARSAIVAMIEPTDAMVAVSDGLGGGSEGARLSVWSAMLAEALRA